jgi:hypothetical protein
MPAPIVLAEQSIARKKVARASWLDHSGEASALASWGNKGTTKNFAFP